MFSNLFVILRPGSSRSAACVEHADELPFACYCEERSDKEIQLDCRGRLRLPRNDKPRSSLAAQRKTQREFCRAGFPASKTRRSGKSVVVLGGGVAAGPSGQRLTRLVRHRLGVGGRVRPAVKTESP